MDGRRAVIVVAIVGVIAWLLFGLIFFIRTGDAMILLFAGTGAFTVLNLVIVALALFHVLTRDDLTGWQRLAWALITGLVNPGLAIGALAYFVLGTERTRALFRDLGGAPSPAAVPAERPE